MKLKRSINLEPLHEDNIHYKRLGIYHSACGLPWVFIRRTSTDLLSLVSCRNCMLSDEFVAQSMEESLLGGGSKFRSVNSTSGATVVFPPPVYPADGITGTFLVEKKTVAR